MKRILVFSDTHGNLSRCIETIDNIKDIDLVIHLGDTVRDAAELEKIFPDIEFKYVSGNNDFYSKVPSKLIVEFDNIRIFCCHGHQMSDIALYEYAKENNCSYVLTGHTHRSHIVKEDGITFMNPGSISRPRDSKCSYGVIETENGNAREAIIGREY